MQKQCKACTKSFEIIEADLVFYKEISPVFNGDKFLIPAPQLCPACRFQRRLLFRNERHLYHRKSDLSGKAIISMFSPDKSLKVYDQEEWWGDAWDGLEYAREFDFSRSFFDQFFDLYRQVPHASLYTNNAENSYYTNFTLNFKNCYLVSGGANCEDCFFSHFIKNCRTSLDLSSVDDSELCYEGVASSGCYNCKFFVNSRNCSDCLMIEDCIGCKNCIGCFGLRRKEYYIFNEFVGKEKYEQFKAQYESLDEGKIQFLRGKLQDLKTKSPHIQSHIYASEDCTGDMILNSKNCHYAFDVSQSEDSKYLNYSPKARNSYDCTFNAPDGVENCYNVCSTVGSVNCISTFLCWYGENIRYSIETAYSQNLFGCVGLKRKEYCILNKQYTKEAYEALMPKIIEYMQKIGEWSEFFPPKYSPFAYNESIAQEYFPLSKEEAIKLSYSWQETPLVYEYQAPKKSVPLTIKDVDEGILNQILICEMCSKLYKIIAQEFAFYQTMGLPIPKQCVDCRHKARLANRNPRFLWERQCVQCDISIQTNYAPDRPEKVLCEVCYLKEVY
ncbi:MAG: hypothetical protein ACD_28C00186G0002 [uncultured bacterium]|nr:MAG: hypothetical protein ACD_28C00186G0002 [uncultured bacterium]